MNDSILSLFHFGGLTMPTPFHQELTQLTLNRFGFDGAKIEQGSDDWKIMRLGVITASRAKDLTAKNRSGKGWGEARKTYLRQLVAEVATGQAKEQGKFKPTEHGHEHEATAREEFSFAMNLPVIPIPFIYGDVTMRYGCSPDGIAGTDSGLELKSPFTTEVYLNFLLDDEIKSEYIDQCQFSMFSSNLNYWHFANYDPRMKKKGFYAVTLERDEEKMEIFQEAVDSMIFDMDSELARLGFVFGDQWVKRPPALALAA
jgi:hypothetical protein